MIREQAFLDARQQANEFAAAVFKLDPPKPENLVTVAKQKGFTVHTPAPFARNYGPQEFTAPGGIHQNRF
ncbi:MAG: hypothetical protein WDM76_19545 [Limisphaerales bacterium]